MSSVEQICRQILESEIMTPQSLDDSVNRWRSQGGSDEDGAGLLGWLVEQQWITSFQGQAIEAGHTGALLLGPYRVYGQAAVGRLGTLYRAIHDLTGQAVGLKVFPSSLANNPEQLARVEREIRVSSEMDHSNVVRTYHFGQVGDIYYLAIEDLQGETLEQRLRRERPLPYPAACALGRDAADGLNHFHDKFLVHRDVRPANLWITEEGTLKVMESGAVGLALGGMDGSDSGTLTTSGTVLGVYDYMAPEQARDAHAADHRSDIYGLGCTLYECLAGQPPFVEVNPIRAVMRHQTEMPQPVNELAPDVPQELSDLVGYLLSKSPDDRPQSMVDVVRELEQFADPSGSDQFPAASLEYLGWLNDVASSESGFVQEPGSPSQQRFVAWLADRRGEPC